MAHRTHEELREMLDEAALLVSTGALYRHNKSGKIYRITGLAVLEADDGIAVRYAAAADATVEFIRPLESFIEPVKVDGVIVPRFEISTD